MTRLASAALAGVFFVASGGIALAANDAPIIPLAPANSAVPGGKATPARPRVLAPGAEQRITYALNLLEAKGYGDFSDFRQDGKNFTATVSQDGKRFTVMIDPDSRRITRQS
jgi:hypothetical protein